MTNDRACANESTQPATNPERMTPGDIYAELDRLTHKATRLSGITSAIALLHPENFHTEATAALVYLAEDLAGQMNTELDRLSVQASKCAFDNPGPYAPQE